MSKKTLFPRPEGLSLVPPALPTGRKEKEEPIFAAFCPLIPGYCSDVQCGKCALPEEEFTEFIWVCSTCTKGLRIHAYYADGECHVCQAESGILMLGVPK